MAEAAVGTGGASEARKVVRPKMGRDDWVMRGFMLVIALYLVIALVFPLYVMLSKSFETFAFSLKDIEVQVDKGEGWGESLNARDLAIAQELYDPARPEASSGHRITAAKLFPDFSFRSPTNYRMRNTDKGGGGFIARGAVITDSEWHEFSSNDFR
ncbi:MAG TPA: hypothetical protein VKN76_14345, partial [Kiloniellaceae bacterium]|nr:hypothetical protein [Kiloniellaceae bacterium]